MREIYINRQKGTLEWTLSAFESDDKMIKGVGVEDEFRAIKVKGETRIPAGRYELILTPSPKFSKEYMRDAIGNIISIKEWKVAKPEVQRKYAFAHEMITVSNVPGFDRILWHWGNTDVDTDGCYIVGTSFGKNANGRDGVISSRAKYEEIYPKMWRALKVAKLFANYIDHE